VASEQTVRAARDLAQRLGLAERAVFFNDWADYQDRQNFLLESDFGVSLSFDHLETTYAFRTRILDCIWAGLPVVCTRGDATADLVEQYGLGLTVTAADEDQVVSALQSLLQDPEARDRRRAGFEQAASDLSWPRVIGPLRRFARQPRIAPDTTRLRASPAPMRALVVAARRWRRALWLVEAVRVSYGMGGVRQLRRDLGRYLAQRSP
jgi:hypothetical protein